MDCGIQKQLTDKVDDFYRSNVEPSKSRILPSNFALWFGAWGVIVIAIVFVGGMVTSRFLLFVILTILVRSLPLALLFRYLW